MENTNTRWNELYYDLLRIKEQIMNLDIALDNSLTGLAQQFQVNRKEINDLENKVNNLHEKTVNKLKNLEKKSLYGDRLNSMLGKSFPLKHEIMQDKFELNEESLKVLNSLKQLVNSMATTQYQLRILNANIQSFKSIKNDFLELDRNFASQLNPQSVVDPQFYYQPIYMIEKTLDTLNEGLTEGSREY